MMLNDDDLEQAAIQLARFRMDTTLPSILDQYAALLENYKRLKSDYEEERDGRERYKQMSKGQGGNPFVLVLVDGDAYVFHETLVGNGANGGRTAAQLLNESIKSSLRKKDLEHCEIMVRVYADVAGLSKNLYRARLTGPEKRSLAPFVASFNRSYGLFDFVDVGEWDETADLKLRAALNLYAPSPQCKHIYFAGCHDGGYISDLATFSSSRERLTLVTAPDVKFQDDYDRLDMEIEEFPGIFQPVPAHTSSGHQSPRSRSGSVKGASRDWRVMATPITIRESHIGPATKKQQKCKFYRSGTCKYGDECKNLHAE
ncbi:uncharacterized protein TrAFT101_011201 [Trichoderma asperellum]|uniref:uncharacterized protein n=1 Tax=Trichoderma asperellum TaxID=101201 RepID=UPI0033165884|nr:hypothetical protein TrAFT101_011201 [Trichoderma asperellum]